MPYSICAEEAFLHPGKNLVTISPKAFDQENEKEEGGVKRKIVAGPPMLQDQATEKNSRAQRARILELQRLAVEKRELEVQLAEVKQLTRIATAGKMCWKAVAGGVLDLDLTKQHNKPMRRRREKRRPSSAPSSEIARYIVNAIGDSLEKLASEAVHQQNVKESTLQKNLPVDGVGSAHTGGWIHNGRNMSDMRGYGENRTRRHINGTTQREAGTTRNTTAVTPFASVNSWEERPVTVVREGPSPKGYIAKDYFDTKKQRPKSASHRPKYASHRPMSRTVTGPSAPNFNGMVENLTHSRRHGKRGVENIPSRPLSAQQAEKYKKIQYVDDVGSSIGKGRSQERMKNGGWSSDEKQVKNPLCPDKGSSSPTRHTKEGQKSISLRTSGGSSPSRKERALGDFAPSCDHRPNTFEHNDGYEDDFDVFSAQSMYEADFEQSNEELSEQPPTIDGNRATNLDGKQQRVCDQGRRHSEAGTESNEGKRGKLHGHNSFDDLCDGDLRGDIENWDKDQDAARAIRDGGAQSWGQWSELVKRDSVPNECYESVPRGKWESGDDAFQRLGSSNNRETGTKTSADIRRLADGSKNGNISAALYSMYGDHSFETEGELGVRKHEERRFIATFSDEGSSLYEIAFSEETRSLESYGRNRTVHKKFPPGTLPIQKLLYDGSLCIGTGNERQLAGTAVLSYYSSSLFDTLSSSVTSSNSGKVLLLKDKYLPRLHGNSKDTRNSSDCDVLGNTVSLLDPDGEKITIGFPLNKQTFHNESCNNIVKREEHWHPMNEEKVDGIDEKKPFNETSLNDKPPLVSLDDLPLDRLPLDKGPFAEDIIVADKTPTERRDHGRIVAFDDTFQEPFDELPLEDIPHREFPINKVLDKGVDGGHERGLNMIRGNELNSNGSFDEISQDDHQAPLDDRSIQEGASVKDPRIKEGNLDRSVNRVGKKSDGSEDVNNHKKKIGHLLIEDKGSSDLLSLDAKLCQDSFTKELHLKEGSARERGVGGAAHRTVEEVPFSDRCVGLARKHLHYEAAPDNSTLSARDGDHITKNELEFGVLYDGTLLDKQQMTTSPDECSPQQGLLAKAQRSAHRPGGDGGRNKEEISGKKLLDKTLVAETSSSSALVMEEKFRQKILPKETHFEAATARDHGVDDVASRGHFTNEGSKVNQYFDEISVEDHSSRALPNQGLPSKSLPAKYSCLGETHVGDQTLDDMRENGRESENMLSGWRSSHFQSSNFQSPQGLLTQGAGDGETVIRTAEHNVLRVVNRDRYKDEILNFNGRLNEAFTSAPSQASLDGGLPKKSLLPACSRRREAPVSGIRFVHRRSIDQKSKGNTNDAESHDELSFEHNKLVSEHSPHGRLHHRTLDKGSISKEGITPDHEDGIFEGGYRIAGDSVDIKCLVGDMMLEKKPSRTFPDKHSPEEVFPEKRSNEEQVTASERRIDRFEGGGGVSEREIDITEPLGALKFDSNSHQEPLIKGARPVRSTTHGDDDGSVERRAQITDGELGRNVSFNEKIVGVHNTLSSGHIVNGLGGSSDTKEEELDFNSFFDEESPGIELRRASQGNGSTSKEFPTESSRRSEVPAQNRNVDRVGFKDLGSETEVNDMGLSGAFSICKRMPSNVLSLESKPLPESLGQVLRSKEIAPSGQDVGGADYGGRITAEEVNFSGSFDEVSPEKKIGRTLPDVGLLQKSLLTALSQVDLEPTSDQSTSRFDGRGYGIGNNASGMGSFDALPIVDKSVFDTSSIADKRTLDPFYVDNKRVLELSARGSRYNDATVRNHVDSITGGGDRVIDEKLPCNGVFDEISVDCKSSQTLPGNKPPQEGILEKRLLMEEVPGNNRVADFVQEEGQVIENKVDDIGSSKALSVDSKRQTNALLLGNQPKSFYSNNPPNESTLREDAADQPSSQRQPHGGLSDEYSSGFSLVDSASTSLGKQQILRHEERGSLDDYLFDKHSSEGHSLDRQSSLDHSLDMSSIDGDSDEREIFNDL